MENRRGNEIFLGVVGVATLVVAIIGATFAFFGATAQSTETAVAAGGAKLQLGYKDDVEHLKYNLIPATNEIAHFAATNAAHIADLTKGECKDDYGNEVCGIYIFTIGNPSTTTQQGLFGNIKIVAGTAETDFVNLWFEILDETGKTVVGPMAFNDALRNKENVIELTELTQQLSPSPAGTFDAEDPTKYPKVCTYGEVTNPDEVEEGKDPILCTQTNVRTYKMVMWIKEMDRNQTTEDSGKVFAAGINFTSANDKTGVTGVISAAVDSD